MTTKIKSSNLSPLMADASFVTGSFTGDLTIADKIVHSGDTNTAIRFPGVDTVSVETSGVERLRISANGNIGIGTSNPTVALDVVGTVKSTAVTTDSVNGVPLRPGILDPENRIINGAFDFWQRGTSFSAGRYGADRWTNDGVGGTVTQSRQSFNLGETLGSNNPTYFLRQTVSGQTLASQLAFNGQRIESVRSYAGQTITVLGWARRFSGVGNMAVFFTQKFGTGGTPSAAVDSIGQTVTLSGVWAPFAVILVVPSITGKTLGTANNDCLQVNFMTSAGSDYNAISNSLGVQTIGVDLWGIHIKVGTHTTDAVNFYKAPELGPELVRCQRYYENAILASGSIYQIDNYSGPLTRFSGPWRVQKRAVPTVTGTGQIGAVDAKGFTAVIGTAVDFLGYRFDTIDAEL